MRKEKERPGRETHSLWPFVVAAVLAAVCALVLSIPIEAKVELESSQKSRLRLGWLFGLAHKELRRSEKKPGLRKLGLPRRGNPGDFLRVLQLLRTSGLMAQFFRYMKDIFRQVRFRNLDADLRIGLEDPADMAMLFGAAAATRPFLHLPSGYKYQLEPCFTSENLAEGYLHAAFSIQPIRLIWPSLQLIFSPASFRFARVMVFGRWKKK